jgi:predicted transcriptional regulator
VAAEAQSKTYGDADPTLTYNADSLVAGDSFTGDLSRASGEDVGTYPINQGTLVINDGNSGNNYTLTYTGADFTINPLAITVTADAKTKIYGNADPGLSYSADVSLVSGDSFTGAISRAAGENVGTYAINQDTLAIDDGNSGNNYTLTYTGADFTINPLAITVTADAKTKIYGDADPALTSSGDIALISGDSFTGALSRAAGEDVGTYAINQGTLAIDDGNGGSNYTLTYTGADFTINPLAITVTADAKTKIYGDADPALTYSGDIALISDDSFTGALSRAAGEDVGNYAIAQNTLAIDDAMLTLRSPLAPTSLPSRAMS